MIRSEMNWTDTLDTTARVAGYTHALYRHPARFAPEFVRRVIDELTHPGELVLDPFMGGATSAVEALAAGRRFVGFDINPLALTLCRAKTTPLQKQDFKTLSDWIQVADVIAAESDEPRLKNAPPALVRALNPFVLAAHRLKPERQRDAAVLLLLRAAQWAVDGRAVPAGAEAMLLHLAGGLEVMKNGLEELAAAAAEHGLAPSRLPDRRVLRAGPAHEVAAHRGLNRLAHRARLVVTSPPYPNVHVLYHRWQVRGRAETPMPYWIADASDGLGAAHYTMGGRSAVGEDRYFAMIQQSWHHLRRLLRKDAVVVQLIAFPRPEMQVSRYLRAMEDAGYVRRRDLEPARSRKVPNRRWYYRVAPERNPAEEIVLAHSPIGGY